MTAGGSTTSPITPRELAEWILAQHEARRRESKPPYSWPNDPDGKKLIALAAMVTRWNVTEEQFEAKLRRLIHLPTGVAAPAAERMLNLWIEARNSGPK